MIHSLSGGVIKDHFKHTFVKVAVEGETAWYLSPTSKAEAGMRVSVPFGKGGFPHDGVILKVEEADAQCAPCPMNRICEIYGFLSSETT